jgi:hypothetical protein
MQVRLAFKLKEHKMILVTAAQNSGSFPRTTLTRNNPRFDDFNHALSLSMN